MVIILSKNIEQRGHPPLFPFPKFDGEELAFQVDLMPLSQKTLLLDE